MNCSLSAIIKSNLYLSGSANGLNYFVLTSEVLFYGLGKLALSSLIIYAGVQAHKISGKLSDRIF